MIPNALYPMGPVTFAIACSFCKNIGSDKCVRCKCEIESGFELKDRHQMTNADRIRAMSDEELANLLTVHSNNSGWVTEIGREICFERIHEWLQKPAENQKEYY